MTKFSKDQINITETGSRDQINFSSVTFLDFKLFLPRLIIGLVAKYNIYSRLYFGRLVQCVTVTNLSKSCMYFYLPGSSSIARLTCEMFQSLLWRTHRSSGLIPNFEILRSIL